VPFLWIAGFDYEAAVRGAGGDDLRIFGVFGRVFPGGSDDPLSPGMLIGVGAGTLREARDPMHFLLAEGSPDGYD
jgi:hypothetical protein